MENPKEHELFEHIDSTLAEYQRYLDHRLVIEATNWSDLMELVSAGEITKELAEERFRDWYERNRAI